MTPELSIIIVSHNARQWLGQCLGSLHAHSEVAAEVIVVENCSDDGSGELVREQFPEVKLLCNAQRLGFAANNQIGALASSAPLLLFLNPDTEVPPGSLRAMLEVVARHPECGVFGSRLLDGEGEVERSVGRFPTLVSIFLDRLLQSLPLFQPALDHYSQRHYRGYEDQRNVDWVTGAALWIRRETLSRAGGWDGEHFFMYYEDVDLCYRARQAGFKVRYIPQSELFHYHNKAPVDPCQRKTWMRQSQGIFMRKHYGPLRGRLYPLLLRLFYRMK
ncbi:MAG: glycosyltransferase family 2 protein [Candidatus Latescibacteria bacterium]|nr:glycosyltransferase family 2 protein [Candidatus Latescibacterota bacterium]